ncbi:MAG TPA: EAL domain-containing protein, partial [Treponemataceae bacterium]|nr:EAL domain-containing protein [Treponemataceae bacterium]
VSRHKFSQSQKRVFLAVILVPFFGVFLQLFLKKTTLECFAASLSVLFLLLTSQDTTELIDGQSGLFNRSAFSHFVEKAFSAGKNFSVIAIFSKEMFELQNLLNASVYGELVFAVSLWLKEISGPNAQVCVLNEGTFTIVLQKYYVLGTDGEIAFEIANRANDPWEIDALTLEIPVQVGIFRCPEDSQNISELSDLIDQLADLPEKNQNRHIFYKKDFVSKKKQRQAFIAYSIRERIEQKTLEIGYQPIYSNKKNQIICIESQLRLKLDDNTIVEQNEIFKISELFGLSQSLTEYSFSNVFAWFTKNRVYDKGIELIQIRIPESQCLDVDWTKNISKLAKFYDMPLEYLCLEITEPSVVHSGSCLSRELALLAEHRVRFALDNFGSGYTYFGQIMEMPFSIIKIDKKIVNASIVNKKARALLLGSISLFKRLETQVVAKGIDTQEHADLAKTMGFDSLQGRFYSDVLTGQKLLDALI